MLDDIEAYEEKLINSPIIDYTMDRESDGWWHRSTSTYLQFFNFLLFKKHNYIFQLGQNIKLGSW
jgi:hypothetical protein